MLPRLDELIGRVQQNCHIADARHARNMTLCSYLLEMREFYRWEHGLPAAEPAPRAEVGRWIAQREALWNDIEESEFSPLPLKDELMDPFANAAINSELRQHGLVYGAGMGRFHKPNFFLGELLRQEERGGVSILVCGCEYARDLTAAPAALLNDTVYLRRESLTRWLWEKVEAWGVRPRDGALKAVLDAYGYESGSARAIESMTEGESETLILHEMGEHAAGLILGKSWEEMLSGFSGRRAEVLARAVRDNLADCLVTLPTLLRREASPSIHFWFSNFDGMRRALFPDLTRAYDLWHEGGQSAALAEALEKGRDHWQDVGYRLLELHRQQGAAAEKQIAALIAEDALAL